MCNSLGFYYYFPISVQTEVFETLGGYSYIKLPGLGTNPRGSELSSTALKAMCEHKDSHKLEINWIEGKLNFNS